MNDKPIGIFDSGIGGITVLNACRDLLPAENYVYVCDPRNVPYGSKDEAFIRERAEALVRELCERGCKAFVAACNTLTNVGIADLRKEYGGIFVGLEPALKPAQEASNGERILLLCTPATARQPKFKELLSRFGGGNVLVSPQDELAGYIERNIENPDALRLETARVLKRYGDVSCVVLGCTHYVFLREYVDEYYGGRVRIFDGNDGAARRLKGLLAESDALNGSVRTGGVKFISL